MIYRVVWYCLSSLCDIAVDQLIEWSIGLFGIICLRVMILLLTDPSGCLVLFVFALWYFCRSIDRSIYRVASYCLCSLCDIAVDRLIDLSGYLVLFVFALWYWCRSIEWFIGLFGIVCLRVMIFLATDLSDCLVLYVFALWYCCRSIYRVVWYCLSSFHDIAIDRLIDLSGCLVLFAFAL